MALTYYERKVLNRSIGVVNNHKLDLQLATFGTLDGKRAACLVFYTNITKEQIDELVDDLSKCFRKADVIRGKGCHRSNAPEITYPTVYVMIKGPNK